LAAGLIALIGLPFTAPFQTFDLGTRSGARVSLDMPDPGGVDAVSDNLGPVLRTAPLNRQLRFAGARSTSALSAVVTARAPRDSHPAATPVFRSLPPDTLRI
jgi:hypothetical protein